MWLLLVAHSITALYIQISTTNLITWVMAGVLVLHFTEPS